MESTDCTEILSSIAIDDELFAIAENGKFGRVEILDKGKCSFIPLCESNYECNSLLAPLLFHV